MKKRAIKNNRIKQRKRKSRNNPFHTLNRAGIGIYKVFMVFIFVGIISFSFLLLYRYLIESPYMRLENIEATGIDSELQNELIKKCQLHSGQSLLGLNLRKIKNDMIEHPWIHSVELERHFPNTLIIRAKREQPFAIVAREKYYYMNREGKIFMPVQSSCLMDLPIITGLSSNSSSVQVKLEDASRILQILEQENGLWSFDHLSEIHIADDEAISLYFGHLSAEIKLKCRELSDTIDRFLKVVKHLKQTGRLHQVSRIDLDYINGAVVSFGKG